MASPTRTHLAFQHDATLNTQKTVITTILPASQHPEGDRSLFPALSDEDFILTTPSTIFHPQGGGQPSDEGTIHTATSSFTVRTVRTNITTGTVLHLGTFAANSLLPSPGDEVTQTIDTEKRLLFSRLHTAGHVLGAATRKLLEHEVPDFDELKASHFPGQASCEFAGSIAGTWKDGIQAKVNEFVDADMEVGIEWWDEADFKAKGLERLIVGNVNVKPGEKWRVVNVGGEDVYPCGGTHVESTKKCGDVTVRKISRSKGTSRVSYAVS